MAKIEEEDKLTLPPEEVGEGTRIITVVSVVIVVVVQVRRRLRERGQPIRLFAESDAEARKRLRRLELDAPELKEGWKNEFQSALNKASSSPPSPTLVPDGSCVSGLVQVDEDFMKEVIAGTAGASGRHDVAVEEALGEITAIKDRIRGELGKGDLPARDCTIIYDFLNYLLQVTNSAPTELTSSLVPSLVSAGAGT